MYSLLLTLAMTASPQVKLASNAICPVCTGEVDETSPAVTLDSQQYRLCCLDCGAPLTEGPDDYLDSEGTPKNAPKPPRKPNPSPSSWYLPE
jgi:hypothetical protein